MYLKELVMVDFKSFKGEVRIPFGRGFTAITGPNGSGNQTAVTRSSSCSAPNQPRPSALRTRKI